ncbi:hypothetical protein, partial [Porphyromonas loveana]|uniref:hypothetical protein n=1 Tax=Porphyromonas loveana TaxID=1884669 RepID=UPI0035A08B63
MLYNYGARKQRKLAPNSAKNGTKLFLIWRQKNFKIAPFPERICATFFDAMSHFFYGRNQKCAIGAVAKCCGAPEDDGTKPVNWNKCCTFMPHSEHHGARATT